MNMTSSSSLPWCKWNVHCRNQNGSILKQHVGTFKIPLRRNRVNDTYASFETWLSAQHLVLPLFIHYSEEIVPIKSMPGCFRLSLKGMMDEVRGAVEDGISSIELFPAIDEALKTSDGKECYNPDGLVPRAIKMLKKEFSDLVVVTDVALDPYSSDGHDGIVDKTSGRILNDESVEILCKQALCHARTGADIIASDMMDGQWALFELHWTGRTSKMF